MKIKRLPRWLLAAALTAAPVTVLAEPATPATETAPAQTTQADTPKTADADRYAAREAKDAKVADFQGGSREYIYVGGGTLTLVLLIVLILILV